MLRTTPSTTRSTTGAAVGSRRRPLRAAAAAAAVLLVVTACTPGSDPDEAAQRTEAGGERDGDDELTDVQRYAAQVCDAVAAAFLPAFDAWVEIDTAYDAGEATLEHVEARDQEILGAVVETFAAELDEATPDAEHAGTVALLTRGVELFAYGSGYTGLDTPPADDELDERGAPRDLWMEVPTAELTVALNTNDTCAELATEFGGTPLFAQLGTSGDAPADAPTGDDADEDTPLGASLSGSEAVVAFAEEVYFRSAYGGEGGPRDDGLLSDAAERFPNHSFVFDDDLLTGHGLVQMTDDGGPWCLWLPQGVAVGWPEFTPGLCDDPDVQTTLELAVATQVDDIEDAGGEVDPSLGFGQLEPDDDDAADDVDVDITIGP